MEGTTGRRLRIYRIVLVAFAVLLANGAPASVDVTGNWDGFLLSPVRVPVRFAIIQTNDTLTLSFPETAVPLYTGTIDPESGALTFGGPTMCEFETHFDSFSGSVSADGATISVTGILHLGPSPSRCAPLTAMFLLNRLPCGDGTVDAGEDCDDGDLMGADCCSFSCHRVFDGTSCDDGDPSTDTVCLRGACTLRSLCGNGELDEGEFCDDGNPLARDCCDHTCAIVSDGTWCDDGSAETRFNVCVAGTCETADVPEAQINRYTFGPQTNPAIACANTGEFVVGWDDGIPSSYNAVRFGRFDGASQPVGLQFTVSDVDYPSVVRARATFDAEGNAITTWSAPNGSLSYVVAQRLGRAGNPIGLSIPVSDVALTALRPDVAANGNNFIVVWQERQFVPPERDPSRVVAQRYDRDGKPIGSKIAVSDSSEHAAFAHVAVDGIGDFVVTWVEDTEVLARQFYGNGFPKASPFHVGTHLGGVVSNPHVGASADGSFVIVWSEESRVIARRHSASARPLGSEIEVSARDGDVAVDANGNFIIVGTTNDDGFGSGIIAQRFDATGSPLGEPLQVNGFTFNDQTSASVCAAPGGDFVIAWKGDQQDGADTGIFARRFDIADQATPTPLPSPCPGDCDGTNVVSVSEMVAGVNILLGRRSLADCIALDHDRNAETTVDELVAAVRASLNGC